MLLIFLNSLLLTDISAMCFGAGLLGWLLVCQQMVDFITCYQYSYITLKLLVALKIICMTLVSLFCKVK